MEPIHEIELTQSYICTLKWHFRQKRLFLGSPQGADAAFRAAIEHIDQIGGAASSWSEFHAQALAIFRQHGFVEVDSMSL